MLGRSLRKRIGAGSGPISDVIFVLCIIGFGMLVSGVALVTSNDEDRLGRMLMLIGAWVGALGLVSLLYTIASAMEGDRHGNEGPLKEWFNTLKSDKGPCCSASDGITITDSDWESRDGRYRVRIPRNKPNVENIEEMVWVDVPDDAVITEPNIYGRTVVWPLYNAVQYGASRPTIRCFMPGTMS